MQTDLDKYFIAIVFEDPLQIEITEMKQFVKNNFNSQGALRSPAHITLKMPFEWKTKKIDLLKQSLNVFVKKQHVFEIELNNFSFFEPRVLFIDVIPNEKLNTLQKELKIHLQQELHLIETDGKFRGFHPHVTIGFRDLKKEQFYSAQKHFIEQTFYCKSSCNSIALLKHDGKIWKVEETFFF